MCCMDAVVTEEGSVPMRYWLMKTEPETFGVEHLAAAPRRTSPWDGVRNYQARNMLRDEMQRGDQAFLYYSSCGCRESPPSCGS